MLNYLNNHRLILYVEMTFCMSVVCMFAMHIVGFKPRSTKLRKMVK